MEETEVKIQKKAENALGQKKVLFVEDDDFLREIILDKLREGGFTVEEAADGESAFKKIDNFRPGLILLDLVLPDINGFEILQKLKRNPRYAKIPVLVLSNLGQKDEIERAKHLGAVDFLIKVNFTPAEVVSAAEKFFR